MATSGYRSDGRLTSDVDNNVERSMKWPLDYVNATKEFMCGWCGQALTANLSHDELETHFQSCKNSKETALLMGYRDLLKVNQKMEGLNADLQTRVDGMKTELMEEIKAEILNIKVEVGKEMEINKTEFKNLENEIKSREASDALLLNKVNVLEEKMTKSEVDIQTTKTQLENEVAHLKTGLETFSGKIKTYDRDLQVLKRRTESEAKETGAAQPVVKKQEILHLEPLIYHQLAFSQELQMNCFNLLTQSGHFIFSCLWNIDKFATTLAHKTFKLSSEVFQWNGYPIQARAKLQLKEDGCLYVSLCLEDPLGDTQHFAPIPRVFYLLKDYFFRSYKCFNMSYLFDAAFSSSLSFESCLGHKSQFTGPNSCWQSMRLEIFVEPQQMTTHVHSYNGTLELKIENYERKLELRKSYFGFYQKNPYFYTSARGYRVQVEIFLKEEVKGKRGLTIIISFLSGKFDAELSQSFPHSTTVTLIHRKDPERSITKTIVEDIKNKKEYKFEICKVEEAANLIEKDTLFCKVSIRAQ